MKANDFSVFCDSVIKLVNESDDLYSYCDRRSHRYFHISNLTMIDSTMISRILSIIPKTVTWYVGTTVDNEPKMCFYY